MQESERFHLQGETVLQLLYNYTVLSNNRFLTSWVELGSKHLKENYAKKQMCLILRDSY